jgi:hypothetical protein
MSTPIYNYIFVDESGDPGKPFIEKSDGSKISTGASLYYILSAICIDSTQLFLLENKIVEIKNKFNYKKEIKSTLVSLPLYKDLLNIINKLNIKIYYRLVDKTKYKGKFAAPGRKNHNVFDEYNLVKLVNLATRKSNFINTEVVIDRADRRLLDGKFENCDNYLKKRVNTKTITRIKHIVHVNSEYVNVMQISDIVSGALKDYFTKRNVDLKKVINKNLLIKIF